VEEENLIFISTEPVYINNKLPAWGGRTFFITATRRNEKMTSLFSQAQRLYRVFESLPGTYLLMEL